MRNGGWLALVVPLVLGLGACHDGSPAGRSSAPTSAQASPTGPPVPLTLEISPATNARNLPISTEISTKVTGGAVVDVSLTEGTGQSAARVAGRMRDDGTAWVPDRPLKHAKTYTATVTARGEQGEARTTATFTTGQPGPRLGSGLYLLDGLTYGMAMPVVVEFDREIPREARAGVERRLFVTTTPAQPGAWAWLSGRQVHYRGRQLWRPGTILTVRVALEGHPMGNNLYGDQDRRATATIAGTKTVLYVDNGTKTMIVHQNDLPVRTMPVSLGKAATPSSSGTMVIMDKQRSMVFDTRSDPDPANRYVVGVEYAQRLTWGGEFIHSAPWSVRDQGVRNVSHGCVNLSQANAQWLFSVTRVGDPVIVMGTERAVQPGNGWTAWDLSWPDFLKLSALSSAPPPSSPAPATTAPATPTTTP